MRPISRRRPAAGAQITCLQEIFYGPYFCAEQQTRWYDFTEPIPDGPTVKRMQELARKHQMALIVPIYEVEQEGVYYNTAAVIDRNGQLSRQVSQNAHPARGARILGEILFPAGQSRLSDLRPGLRRASASTFVTTAIFRKARARWG